MAAPVPSLDTVGWVYATAPKADRVMANFLVSEYSQTNAHKGKVFSLPYLLHKFPNNPTELRMEIRSALQNLFFNYFDSAEAEVEMEVIRQEDGKQTSKLNIKTMVMVTQDGKKYSLGRLIDVVDGKIAKVVDLSIG